MKDLENSLTASILKDLGTSPLAKVVRSLEASPTASILKNLETSPTASILKNLETSPTASILKNLETSPTASILKDLGTSPLAKVVRSLENSPMARAMKKLENSPTASILKDLETSLGSRESALAFDETFTNLQTDLIQWSPDAALENSEANTEEGLSEVWLEAARRLAQWAGTRPARVCVAASLVSMTLAIWIPLASARPDLATVYGVFLGLFLQKVVTWTEQEDETS